MFLPLPALIDAEIDALTPSARSRLNTIAELLREPEKVVYLVLIKHISNNENTRAFCRLCGMTSQGTDNSNTKETLRRTPPPHIDLAFAKKMIISIPAKIRFEEGTFRKGR